MTQHDDTVYVGHMLDMARTARKLVDGITREQFAADVTRQLALIRALEGIGEAGGQVSAPARASLREVPWSTIVAMRHRLAHCFLNVDLDVVWQTAQHDLPRLITIFAAVVPPLPPE
jgi:uncharacterized protein with HEPN domain